MATISTIAKTRSHAHYRAARMAPDEPQTAAGARGVVLERTKARPRWRDWEFSPTGPSHVEFNCKGWAVTTPSARIRVSDSLQPPRRGGSVLTTNLIQSNHNSRLKLIATRNLNAAVVRKPIIVSQDRMNRTSLKASFLQHGSRALTRHFSLGWTFCGPQH